MKSILVTGSHRSGTTWTGKNLALAPRAAYLREPFSLSIKIGLLPKLFQQWYQYIGPENECTFSPALRTLLRFSYPLLPNLKKAKTIEDFAKITRDQSLFLWYRCFKYRPIIKDPLAFFSAEWLHSFFDLEVVVMVRHPASFCSSLKIKNWHIDFSQIAQQPILIDRYLKPFEEEIHYFANHPGSLLEHACLFWNCIQHTTNTYKQIHPDWIFLRHEDLSKDPVIEFKKLYARLNLKFTSKVEYGIVKRSGSHNPSEQSSGNEFVRDSRANISNWKNRLTKEEIKIIKMQTAKYADPWYSESDW